jgi:hypothetical protein
MMNTDIQALNKRANTGADRTGWKTIPVHIITYTMAGLFTLAAATKILKYATYRSYFSTSKLVSPFWGPYVAITLIMAEILIAFLLLYPKTRKAGLIAALGMLPLYHYYIYYVLNKASFTPCSCLGAAPIGWEAHYILNAIVLLAGLLALKILFAKRRWPDIVKNRRDNNQKLL